MAAGRGAENRGIYYVATIVSETYEHPVKPSDPAHFRWRTDIRFDCRIHPPLLRSELLDDVQVGSFRPFRGRPSPLPHAPARRNWHFTTLLEHAHRVGAVVPQRTSASITVNDGRWSESVAAVAALPVSDDAARWLGLGIAAS